MADKLIGALPEATSIAGNDLLVTEQTSIAKKITAQNLLDSLDELWTEHGGVESFELYSTSGLSKTYRMTYADGTYTDITITDGTGITDIVTTTSGLTHTITISLNDGTTKVFTVDDGVGISSISAPSTVGLEDTYTINLSDGSTSSFTVTNGASVSSITLNGTTITFAKDDGNTIDLPVPTLRIRYSVTQPDDDNDIITTPSNWMGVAWALDSAVLHYTDYAWFKIKGETGDNAEVSSYTRQYKYDTDGTQAPTTGYYSTIAAAQSAVGGAIQGKYLWIATTVTWNNGTPTVIYSASYQGLDGTGLSGVVKSIYMTDTGISLSPDSNGQVTISDADIGSIADPATKSDGQVLTWDATDQVWYAGSVATGTVNSVNSQLPDVGGNVTIYGTNVAMSSTDSTTVKAAIDAKPDDLSDLGVTVSATELNYTVGVTSNIQDQLDAKPNDLADLGITASATELNYTDGVTSNIQDQLDTKAKAVSHTATGAIASFYDGTGNMPVVDLVADIDLVQNLTYGDPYPAGGGKNKIGITNWKKALTSSGITFTPVFDTAGNLLYITGTGTSTGRAQYTNNITVLPSAGTYTLSQTTPVSNSCTSFINYVEEGTSKYLDIDTITGQTSATKTIGELSSATYTVEVRNAGVTIKDFRWYPQLELGSTATAWQPYSNICPISGWTGANVTRTGKNLLDSTIGYISANGLTYQRNQNDGSIAVSGTATGMSYIVLCGKSSIYDYNTPILKAGVTVICSTGTSRRINLRYTDGTYLAAVNDTLFTPQKDVGLFYIQYNSGETANETLFPMIRLASDSDATYETYQGNTVTVDWTTEAGTVYGGTIDVATGLLTVDRVLHTATTNDRTGLFGTGTNANRVGIMLPDSQLSPTTTQRFDVVCNTAKPSLNILTASLYAVGDCLIYSGGSDTYSTFLFGVPSSCTTAKLALDYLVSANCQFVYRLATPQTYQLTPQEVKTLFGTNNIWADTGDITVKYIDVDSDLSDYFVEKSTYKSGQLLQDRNLAYVERGTRASRAYSVGDFFVNSSGVLCKITAAVANGGTLTSGTNYTAIGGNGGLSNEIIHYYTAMNPFATTESDTAQTLITKAITNTVANLTSGYAHITFSYPNHSWGGDVQVFVCNYVGSEALAVSGTLYIINGLSSTPGGAYIYSGRWNKSTSAITALKVSSAISLALVS